MSCIIQSYTDYNLDLDTKYNNGFLTDIFIDSLNNKRFNTDIYKDYYFIIMNKITNIFYTNSILVLSSITLTIFLFKLNGKITYNTV